MTTFGAALRMRYVMLPHSTFFDREEGQDMVEYALLAALISLVAIAIVFLIGPYLRTVFQDVINALNAA